MFVYIVGFKGRLYIYLHVCLYSLYSLYWPQHSPLHMSLSSALTVYGLRFRVRPYICLYVRLDISLCIRLYIVLDMRLYICLYLQRLRFTVHEVEFKVRLYIYLYVCLDVGLCIRLDIRLYICLYLQG